MSVDLRSNTLFSRISLVIQHDSLVKLEHGRTQDRVRKYLFDGIESVVIWQSLPWVRILICLLLLVLPGAALQFVGETFFMVVGLILIVLGMGLGLWYLIARRTTIRIVRAGTTTEFTGIFRPKQMRRFRTRLIAGIQAAQPVAEATSVEPPVETLPDEMPSIADEDRWAAPR